MIEHYLEAFKRIEKSFPAIINDCIHLDFKQHSGHIVVGSIIHGNETGSLPATIEIIQKLIAKKILYGGKISFFLGNKKAALQNKRFIDHDLNRCFAEQNNTTLSHEKKRALDLKNLLITADVFIDFHQTTRPSLESFYIFAMHKQSYLWARAIGSSRIFVTRRSSKPYSIEGMCSDEYVRSLNKPGITLELGQQGINQYSTEVCLKAIINTIKTMDLIKLKNRNIIQLAKKNQDFKILEMKYSEKFHNNNTKLLIELKNLEKVTKNQKLGELNKEHFFYAPFEGHILFPQYPERNQEQFVIEPLPTYIYSLATAFKGFPK